MRQWIGLLGCVALACSDVRLEVPDEEIEIPVVDNQLTVGPAPSPTAPPAARE